MLPHPTYFVLLSLCLIYALLKGGPPERLGTAIMVFGSALTWAVSLETRPSYRSVATDVMLVDVAAFLAFVILAARSDRFWTIWVSALAGLGLLAHWARWYGGPEVSPRVYFVSLVIWSYAILALLAIGTWNPAPRAPHCTQGDSASASAR